jgi:hypothetical protein
LPKSYVIYRPTPFQLAGLARCVTKRTGVALLDLHVVSGFAAAEAAADRHRVASTAARLLRGYYEATTRATATRLLQGYYEAASYQATTRLLPGYYQATTNLILSEAKASRFLRVEKYCFARAEKGISPWLWSCSC